MRSGGCREVLVSSCKAVAAGVGSGDRLWLRPRRLLGLAGQVPCFPGPCCNAMPPACAPGSAEGDNLAKCKDSQVGPALRYDLPDGKA